MITGLNRGARVWKYTSGDPVRVLTKNIQISDSIVEKIHIDPPTPFTSGRIQLQNITRGLIACNPGDYDIQDPTTIQVNVACYPN